MKKVQNALNQWHFQKPCQIWLQEMLLCVSEQTVSCKSINTARLIKRCHWGAFRSIKFGFPRCHVSWWIRNHLSSFAIAGFKPWPPLSTTEDPTRASIPFDKDRNGFVMGEGSGMLVPWKLRTRWKTWGDYLGRCCWLWKYLWCLPYDFTSSRRSKVQSRLSNWLWWGRNFSRASGLQISSMERQLLLMKREKVVQS